MESTLEKVKRKIWLLCSKAISVPRNSNLAGALCVHESGLLMSTIFGVCPRTKSVSPSKKQKKRTKSVSNDGVVRYLSRPEDFEVTAYDFIDVKWDVKLVYKCTEFGILFYQVVNCGVKFDCVNLENVNQEQFPLKNVFAYLHHNFLSYSTLSAIKSYPFPSNHLTFPDDVSASIVARLTSDQITNLYYDTMDCDPPYRMVENTVNIEACNKGNVGADGLPNPPNLDGTNPPVGQSEPPNPDDDILPEALYLYTKLPLVQFSGLGCDMKSGSSGCPVFKMENNDLVGLILFNLNSSCFAVPLSVLQHCFRMYMRERKGGRSGKSRGKGREKRSRGKS